MLRKALLVLFLFSFLIGCNEDDDGDNNLVEPAVYDVAFSNLDNTIVAIEGATRSDTFLVSVKTPDGLVVSNKTVSLEVAEGPGSIDPEQIETNTFGVARAIYTLQMIRGEGEARITGEIDGNAGSATIRLIGINKPAFIELTADTTFAIAPEDENVAMQIDALVTDAAGRAIPGINLRFGLIPYPPDTTIFGSLTQPNPTDQNGEASTTFRSNGSYGKQKVFCTVNEPDGYLSEIRDELAIEVRALDDEIGSFQITASPNLLRLAPSQVDTADIVVNVRDNNRLGMPGVDVEIRTDFGFVQEDAVTDGTGQARVKYIIGYEDIPDTANTSTIYASIPGTDWATTTVITTIPEGAGSASLRFSADTHEILADNGQTYANLTAVLRNQYDLPLPGETIIITSTHGVAQSPVITDENGVARSRFTDAGVPSMNEFNELVPAAITARSDRYETSRSLEISILPWDVVSEIQLQLSANRIVAGAENDSITVTVNCLRPNGSLVGSGIPVYFEVDIGRIYPANALTDDGVATSYYFPRFEVGVDTILAWTNSDQGRLEDAGLVSILAGPPARMYAEASVDTLIVNDPVSYSEITVEAVDSYDNPASSGITVHFETTLGTIDETAITDNAGTAVVRLRPGDREGAALVTATIDSELGELQAQTAVTFVPGMPDSLILTANPRVLRVQDGGGATISEIRAEVKDQFGGMLLRQVPVRFQLLSAHPDSAHQVLNEQTESTEEGVALWGFESGSDVITRFIRAYTWRDWEREDTLKGLVRIDVLPGEADDIEVNYNPEAFSLGGSVTMEAWAQAWDLHLNPIEDGVRVSFYLNGVLSQHSVVGNAGHFGGPEPGRAYVLINYNSADTFDEYTLSAQINTDQGAVEDAIVIRLPLLDGELDLNIDPANWHFNEENEVSEIRIWVILRDGHQILINNGVINFTSQRGNLFWFNEQSQEFERGGRRVTGLVDDENEEQPGQATVYLRATEEEIFQNPNVAETTVRVMARLEGYEDIVVEGNVLFTRQVE